MRKRRSVLKSSMISNKRMVDSIIEQTKQSILKELGSAARADFQIVRAAQSIATPSTAGSYGSVYIHGIVGSEYASSYWNNATGTSLDKGNLCLAVKLSNGQKLLISKINAKSL